MATRVRQGQIRGGEPQYADLLEEIAALKAAINSLSAPELDDIKDDLLSIQNYLDVTLESRLQELESLLVEQGFEIVYNDFGLIEKLVFDDTSETVLIYDLQGNISQVVTPTSTKTLVYDGLGRLIGVDVS